MACKRSAVRSRLAPPAFACFASYGSASHAEAYRSEASEGCRRAKTDRNFHKYIAHLGYAWRSHARAEDEAFPA